jgi:integrase/recombinase XerD
MGQAASVNLTKYVRISPDQWRFCPVVTSSNGQVKPDHVLVSGKATIHQEGSYYIEWYERGKRRRQSVGNVAVDAQAAQHRQEQVLAATAAGIEVVDHTGERRVETADVCADFLDEVLQHRRPKTYHQYKVALGYFQQSCRKKYLVEIDRRDLMNYIVFLRETKALSQRTISTKLYVVLQLLKANGISGLIAKRDRPRYVEPEPDVYSPEELDKFFQGSAAQERLLFEFFLMTGLREAEVQNLRWKDVDLKEHVVRVSANEKQGFVPKDWEEREVPIPDRLAEALKRHKAGARSDSQLLFATTDGKRNGHFLRQVKAIALRAGLNCGNCDNGRELCALAPCCDNWYLHKFRATFATMHLRAGVDLRTVQHWMGHKDLASTMRYLKPARGRVVREKVNHTFAGIDSAAVAVRA